MPYMIMENDSGDYCVHKHDAEGQPMGESLGCHKTKAEAEAQMAALYANEPAASKAFAIPKNDRRGDSLPLDDKGQIEGAITIVATGEYRGNAIKPPLSDDEKAQAKRAIRKAINASSESEDWKKQELARLEGKADTASSKAVDTSSVKALLAGTGSTAIKSLGTDRFGGYLVVFGDTRQKDLTGEYFNAHTKGLTDLFSQLGKLPALYHHGKNEKLKATLVGMIDTMEDDDIGLWAEGELNKRNKYIEAIRKLLGKSALSWSSGALPATVEKTADGFIKTWVIAEGTMTPTPAEPRLTDISHLVSEKALAVACKAMNLQLPDDLLTQDDADGVGDSRPGNHEYNPIARPRRAQDSARPVHAPAAKSIVKPTSSKVRTKDVDEITDIETSESLDAAEEGISEVHQAVKGVIDEIGDMKRQVKDTTNAALIAMFKELAAEVKGVKRDVADGKKSATKTLPNPQGTNGQSRIEILTATKYSSLEPQDMSFLHTIMTGSKPNWNPGEEFYRELAHRTVESVQQKKLPPDALKGLIEKMGGTFKANELDSTGQAGYGQEWAPDSWRSELWLKVRQDNTVAPLFDMVEMPTQPYELPIETTDPTVYYVPETTDITQLVYTSGNPITLSKIGSSKIQLSSKKLALRVSWSSELNEDSLIPIIANYRRQSLRAMQNAIDNLLVNGDTAAGASANVNLIDGTPTAGSKYLAFDGLRKYALVTNTAQGKDGAGAVTLPLLRQTRWLLSGAYAIQPRQCAWIVDDSAYPTLLNMPEFITMDKAGQAATNLTGQIGVMDGVPVFATAELGLAQATGKISATPANNTKGQAIIVFRPNWVIGYRRQVQAMVEYVSFADAYHLVVTARLVLASFDTKSAAELYDLTV